MICEYVGEVVSIGESNRRGSLAELTEDSYLYELDSNRQIDCHGATTGFGGSLMKFANNAFGEMANCDSRRVNSSGQHYTESGSR